MIYSLNSEKYIETIPYYDQYKSCRSRLRNKDYEAIKSHLKNLIIDSEIQTSSWIPGADWTGSVFEPIYADACFCDPALSAKFFGQLLWEVVMEDSQTWSFGRYEKDGIPIEGLTYFVLSNPPRTTNNRAQPSGPTEISDLIAKYKK